MYTVEIPDNYEHKKKKKRKKTFARYKVKVNLDFLKILCILLLTAFYPNAMLHMQKFFKKG